MPPEIDPANDAQTQNHSFHVGHVWDELMQDGRNTLRVAGTLGHGGLNYAGDHKIQIVEQLAGAAAVGFVAGAVLTAAPVLGTAAIVVGGAAAIYEGFHLVGESVSAYKKAAPDISMVWNADSHEKSDVAKAEKNVEEKTGHAVSDLVVVPLSFAAAYGGARLGAATVTGVQEALANAGNAGASDESVSLRSDTTRARVINSHRSSPLIPQDAQAPSAGNVAMLPDDATTVTLQEKVIPNNYSAEVAYDEHLSPYKKYVYHNPETGAVEDATYDDAVAGYFHAGTKPEFAVSAKVFTGADGANYIQAGSGHSYSMRFNGPGQGAFHLGSTPVEIPPGASKIWVDADGDTYPLWRAINLSRFSK